MPLGYCTRASCAEAGQREDKLRAALASLVADLDDPEPVAGDATVRAGTEATDLGPMFTTPMTGSYQRCSACGAALLGSTSQQLCSSCGYIPPSPASRHSALRLYLRRSLSGFPGQTLTLPKGGCRLSLNHSGLAVVTRRGQRPVVELQDAPGETVAVSEKETFGLHTHAADRQTLQERQTLRIGQQLLLLNRSPMGTYPSAGRAGRDPDTRLAAPALRRAPWYLHRLLPNGSVGDLIPLVGEPSVGDSSCDIDLKDPLVRGRIGHFEASDELVFVREDETPVWVQARAGELLQPGEDIWIGDGIYRLERSHD